MVKLKEEVSEVMMWFDTQPEITMAQSGKQNINLQLGTKVDNLQTLFFQLMRNKIYKNLSPIQS